SASTNIEQILQKRERDHRGKTVYAKDASGAVVSNGPKRGVPLSDVWDIPYLNPKAKERVGYPTQKPILLLDRIICLCSEPNDHILDPFCGSGSSIVAAQMSGRNAIGIDISRDAIDLTKTRLANPIATRSRLLEVGRDEYLREDADLLAILGGIDFHPVQRNKGVDAILKQEFQGRSVFVRIQRKGEPLDTAISQLRKSGIGKSNPILLLVATDPNFQQNTYGKDIFIVKSTSLSLQDILETTDQEDLSSLPLFPRFA
ncbi:MAG TPA: site-specific DNA-methyltransferase, partial [Rhabdochlamydiaceae bacterium]